MRFFLGTHKLTPTLGMCGDMGWYSLEVYRKVHAFRLWNRFIEMPDNRITKKIFRWDYNQCCKNWSSDVRRILCELDLKEIFDDMHICTLNDLSDALKEEFEFAWEEKVTEKVKLRTYNIFKEKFGQETYLKLNLDRSDRSFLSQFRLGILPLHVETGRFNRTAYLDRKCKFCNQDAVEDEVHFLLKCDMYKAERETLLTKARECNDLYDNLSDEKLYYLLNDLGRQTAKFVKNAYNKRYHIINRVQ